MTWTTDKPTVPGWYWFTGTGKATPVMVEVRRGFSNLIVRSFLSNSIMSHTLKEIDGQWSGPILPPEEAP